jgi:hypothetical protein
MKEMLQRGKVQGSSVPGLIRESVAVGLQYCRDEMFRDQKFWVEKFRDPSSGMKSSGIKSSGMKSSGRKNSELQFT